MSYETRPNFDPVECRAVDGGRMVAAGVAIRYGARSSDLGGFVERIMPGAAKSLIKSGSDVLALYEHDQRAYLGRTSNGTLRLADTRSELAYEVDLPDTEPGREVAHLLERGDLRGSSFGFRADPAAVKWTTQPDGTVLRSIHAFQRLRDVGPTIAPAYEDSTAELAYRSIAAETGVDLRTVAEAAAAGELAELIERPDDDAERELEDVNEDETVDDEEPVIHRRPASWFV